MLLDSHEKYIALKENNVDVQKELCRNLYRAGNYLTCFLLSSKLVEMGEEREKIVQLSSLARLGYIDLVFHAFESDKEKIERHILAFADEDLDIAVDLLFSVDTIDECESELAKRIENASKSYENCRLWLDLRRLSEKFRSKNYIVCNNISCILEKIEKTEDSFIKTRASYRLYDLGIEKCREYLNEKYLKHEEKQKTGFNTSDDIYCFEIPENIAKKIWYFNYQDHHVHFFTYPDHNIHFLRFENEILVLDCGSNPKEFSIVDIEGFLTQKGYSTNMIKAVLISHAHYDHYSCLQYLPHSIPLYATKETIDLIFIVNREHLESKKINLVKCNEEFEVGKFRITPFSNGHILGSVGFDIQFGNKRLIYTGDFSLHNQMTAEGMNLQDILKRGKVNYLVSEHTYGQKDFAIKYEDAAKCLAYAVDFLVTLGIKVFIPAFSIGRAQEVIEIIFAFCRTKPMVVVDGLAKDISLYYSARSEKNFFHNVILGSSKDIENNVQGADVIVASSGMLQSHSTAVKYLQILKDTKFGFIKTGYIEDQHYIHEMVKVMMNSDVYYFDIPLSAHSNYFELLQTFRVLEPEKIILVHGQGIKGL